MAALRPLLVPGTALRRRGTVWAASVGLTRAHSLTRSLCALTLLVLRSPSMVTIQIALALLSNDPRLPAVAATSNFGPYLAGCTLVILPTVIIFLAMQRYFLRGILQGGIKG